MTTHPAAYVDWECAGCKTLFYADPDLIDPDVELCDSCQREEDEAVRDDECDCRGCLSA